MIGKSVDWVIRFVLGTIFRLLCRMTHCDSHLVPKEGPFILACNHVTWIDSFLLIAACPRRVRFIITKTFHKKRFVYPITHNTHCIPVDKKKPRSAVFAAISALKSGEAVCIYPEGGFTHEGRLREIQRGVEVMARGADCPTVPVVITGLFGSALALRKGWTKSHLWEKPWPRVQIRFGEPISSKDISSERLKDRLESLIEANSKRPENS